ncbi:hypothetical protein GMORB2_2823 [Geosmithia morbida]|uniref:magnesium chelatase n=1 Tax=Geosmithia morbida TaxID=1094350 RepID=A0A9P4YS73_9HYPO|nr:uncharacterized protein GMORB2_2823 [Geosmithia morbida]KAF4120819.1 hypothetical protein GMORB2_2823 [Geosmithia morbida]
MTDDETVLLEKVHSLSDLELALLLSFTARQHCIISTLPDVLDDLVQELQLVIDPFSLLSSLLSFRIPDTDTHSRQISTKTFGLPCAVVNCDSSTTLDSFSSCLLTQQAAAQTPTATAWPNTTSDYFSLRERHNEQQQQQQSFPFTAGGASSPRIANVVLVRNLDRAPQPVQIQALELLRLGRILTRTSAYSVPKPFLFIPVLGAESGGQAHVARHVNDHFFLSHWHDPDEGLVNLDGDVDEYGYGSSRGDDDTASTTESVVKTNPAVWDVQQAEAIITPNKDIDHLDRLQSQVNTDIEVTRYQNNVISFLRMHRAVADGISPAATKHLELLSRCLAPLHGLTFVTPGLVGLAAAKVYQHRIRITPPEKERSMQWGSRVEAVESVLHHVGPEEVIEDVLGLVPAPL